MGTQYNRLAGQSVARIEALSDGLFAVAMTLLVLDIRAPSAAAIQSEAALWQGLVALAPRLLVYLMSFLTLGIFWVGQQTQLNHVARGDRNLAWLHLGFLFTVSLTPFSTALMAEFITFRLALLIYWLNILLMGIGLYLTWRYARVAGLAKPDLGDATARSIRRRIVIAQSLYAFGALLCVFGTFWSLAFIIVVQMNYVFAPRIGILWRL